MMGDEVPIWHGSLIDKMWQLDNNNTDANNSMSARSNGCPMKVSCNRPEFSFNERRRGEYEIVVGIQILSSRSDWLVWIPSESLNIADGDWRL